MGYYPSQPVYYDYGNNVTYQDNSVYVNGQDAGVVSLLVLKMEDVGGN